MVCFKSAARWKRGEKNPTRPCFQVFTVAAVSGTWKETIKDKGKEPAAAPLSESLTAISRRTTWTKIQAFKFFTWSDMTLLFFLDGKLFSLNTLALLQNEAGPLWVYVLLWLYLLIKCDFIFFAESPTDNLTCKFSYMYLLCDDLRIDI